MKKLLSIALLLLATNLASAKEFNIKINPENSGFTYEELESVFKRNAIAISRASSHTFLPFEETHTNNEPPTFPNKVIRWRPPTEFSRPNIMALAAQGIKYNTGNTGNLNLQEVRRLGLHELGHNVQLYHTSYRYSIMTQSAFRSNKDYSMLWRKDLLDLHASAPKTPEPVGYISVDEDLRILIPSIMAYGEEHEVRLRSIGNGTWLADVVHAPNDGRDMVEQAFLMPGDELHLHNVLYMGLIYPLVKMKIEVGTHTKFTLIQ